MSGFLASVNQPANSSRVARPFFFICCKKRGGAGITISPDSSIQSPLESTRISLGSTGPVTIVRVIFPVTSNGETTFISGSRVVGNVLLPRKVCVSSTSAKKAAIA